MFNKLLYLWLIITKGKKHLTYNNFYNNNKCYYTVSNVISWIIYFKNLCKNLLSNKNYSFIIYNFKINI